MLAHARPSDADFAAGTHGIAAGSARPAHVLAFERLLQQHPHDEILLRGYGRFLVKREGDAAAIRVWESVRSLKPNDSEASSQLAALYLRSGEPVKSLNAAATVLLALPSDDRARRLCLAATLQVILAAAKTTGGSVPAAVDAFQRQVPGFDAVVVEPLAKFALNETPPEISKLRDAYGPTFVKDLVQASADCPAEARAILDRQMRRAALAKPEVLAALFEQYVAGGDAQRAIAILQPEGGPLFSRTSAPDDLLAAARTAFKDTLLQASTVQAMATLLTSLGHEDAALELWQSAARDAPQLRRALLRSLYASRRFAAYLDEALPFIEQPLDGKPAAEQNFFVDLVRQATRIAASGNPADASTLIAAALAKHPRPSRLLHWAEASLAAAKPDIASALAHLDSAQLFAPFSAGLTIDIEAERALLLMRYHRYAEAEAAFSRCLPTVLEANPRYAQQRERLRQVSALCTETKRPLRFPESLVDIVVDDVADAPIRYDAHPAEVCMVTASLGQGGGERQVLTVLGRLARDRRIAKLALLVRSIHRRPNDDALYLQVRDLGVDHEVYGFDWNEPSDILECLPELFDRPRLRRAIDLLPHNVREEAIRLIRQILDRRPHAVQLWQDMYAAALACAIAGVPHFFVQRGSLSPAHWSRNEHQDAVHFRTMRYVYQRLLERPSFLIVNNSLAGCRSDQSWTQWQDDRKFVVVHNAIDFSALGAATGRNDELRRKLGIDPSAPVVGGAFRLEPVKRPLLWIEAAHSILQRQPGAHFIIIGDGEMTAQVQEFARAQGFSQRLHMPGHVNEVGAWYRTMDLLLLTSEREGIPNTLIEAQYYGLPIIASDVGGVAEAMEVGRTGFLVSGEAPTDFADAVVRVLNDPTWRLRARERGPLFVRGEFDLGVVADRVVALYNFGPPVPLAAAGAPAGETRLTKIAPSLLSWGSGFWRSLHMLFGGARNTPPGPRAGDRKQ